MSAKNTLPWPERDIHYTMIASLELSKQANVHHKARAIKTLQITFVTVCVIKVCSNGGATYILGKIIAKDNLNIENLMQTFENLLLQNCATKFIDITYK